MLQNYTKKGREQNLFSTYSLPLCIFSAQTIDEGYYESVGVMVLINILSMKKTLSTKTLNKPHIRLYV